MLHRVMVAIWVAMAGAGPVVSGEIELFTVGAGDVTGGYYSAASAICQEVNRAVDGQMRCSPDPTSGSIYNLDALRRGELDFALVQSDWQRRAFEGTGRYAAIGPMTDLRSVMGLYPELLTILARRDAGIAGISDLAGKRVDIGHPSSGRRGTVDQVLRTLGMSTVDFESLGEYPAGVALDSICAGTIDATILVLGHPNAALARTLAECDAVLVPLTPAESEAIVMSGTDIRRALIPLGSYPEVGTAIMSVAVIATVVTRQDVDPAIVRRLVSTTIAQLEVLGREAPVLADVDPEGMRANGLTAPLHPGAEAAFDAAGYR